MNGRIDAERILAAYLAPEADRLPDRVLDAALADIARTPQRRALRVPWRFQFMPARFSATTVAAVALVAVIGVGGIAYLNSRSPGGPGGPVTPSPTLTTTPGPTPSPAPSQVAPGITAWTTYTSRIYGITFGFPDGWRLFSAARLKWPAGDQPDDPLPYAETFVNPDTRDGDEIAMAVWQQPAVAGEDITSRDGLAAWFEARLCDDAIDACETVPDVAIPMCLGRATCLPAVVVPLSDSTQAVYADTETGLVTIVSLGRPDGFPAAARYGGAVQLLKSILTTMDVWTPEPGQIPAGG